MRWNNEEVVISVPLRLISDISWKYLAFFYIFYLNYEYNMMYIPFNNILKGYEYTPYGSLPTQDILWVYDKKMTSKSASFLL